MSEAGRNGDHSNGDHRRLPSGRRRHPTCSRGGGGRGMCRVFGGSRGGMTNAAYGAAAGWQPAGAAGQLLQSQQATEAPHKQFCSDSALRQHKKTYNQPQMHSHDAAWPYRRAARISMARSTFRWAVRSLMTQCSMSPRYFLAPCQVTFSLRQQLFNA